MALDFPSSPTNGQTFGQYTYDSTKGAWRVTPQAQSAVISSATAPSNPVAGALWYNTNDGATYVYYTDVDTSQWVEIRSQIATSQVGLVPIVPTSVVAISSGTASVNTTGTVTYSGTAGVALNGVFSSAYSSYRIVHRITSVSAVNAGLRFRYRKAGTDGTATQFFGNGSYSRYNNSNGTTPVSGENSGFIGWATTYAPYNSVIATDVFNPYGPTTWPTNTAHASANDGGGIASLTSSMIYQVADNYDGWTFFPSTGTIGGTIQVYGYR